ncbi:MAG TPA: hypothetical protein VFO67_10985 [Gemmatimonadales bacterium]|nr:hypothetical protein [Gemmatimonadales bacterium]
MKRLLGVTIVAGTLLTGLSCGGDGGTGSGPGVLQVKLTSPAANADSAIEITITGPVAPTGATAGTGLRLFQDPGASGTTRHYALTGRLTNGATILTINVADVGAFSQYHGTIEGVSQDNYQLRALSGYALALTR